MHSSEILSFENDEVSRLLIELSSGENSLLNERSKTLMPAAQWLQIGDKYPLTLERKRFNGTV